MFILHFIIDIEYKFPVQMSFGVIFQQFMNKFEFMNKSTVGSVGSCFADILTEFEKLIVSDLINSGNIQFYRGRYV